MHITASEAAWLLIPALPMALWIAWSDLSSMRIANKSVLILGVGFLVTGLIALPLDVYLWRLAQLAVVLAIGFVLNAAGLVGGGDAKYAAAMAPFFAREDGFLVMQLFAAMLLAAFVTHRVLRRIPAVRRATADWKSWDAGRDFPMGLALSGTLIVYLALPFVLG
jgi:prepilin peptidase CpaA